MPDFEKLGAFYLGKLYDLHNAVTQPDLLLYDAKDLTTHAICVGMTGSGKTGLCVSLLEEAAIDGIPAIAIDPKGDLGNLLLAFPQLRPEDFRPWIEEREATAAGLTVAEYAARVAQKWSDGLAQWGQDPERIDRYRSAVDLAIYTPGSDAGRPLAVLQSLDAPPAALLEDTEAYQQRISTAVSGLLALLGIDVDPIRSREHILLSKLIDRAWRAGRNLDLTALIRDIQQPPFDKIGLMDLETIFPAKDRFSLAIALNNLLASPSFSSWLQGDPLDIKRLLYTVQGKPRLSIISIAHLSDAERMFFVTILLNEVLAWARGQAGTSSLRALLYMDEVQGYFPPVANPPAKAPMLTLLKQARAYGLGVILATQNPVDLDYKGLANIGTWFLGRLQTERDKARVLEGLEGAAAQSGSQFDRQQMESVLAALGNRVFLMNNVHEDEPVVFQTRWALSYLRGPLTRQQIHSLMAERLADGGQRAESVATPPLAVQETISSQARVAPRDSTAVPVSTSATMAASERPVVPTEAGERFLAVRSTAADGERLVYRPALLGVARLHFVRASYKVDLWKTVSLLRAITEDADAVDTVWEKACAVDMQLSVEDQPRQGVPFAPLPAPLCNARTYSTVNKQLANFLYRQHTLTLWKSADLKQISEPQETEGDFRIRLVQLAKEERDREAEKLRNRYADKLATLQDRIRRAQQRVDREKSQYRSQQWQSAISVGTSILGALFGRKLASKTNVTSAGSAVRSLGRAAEQHGDIGRAAEGVEALQAQLAELEAEFAQELKQVQQTPRADELVLETLEVRPRKSDVNVEKCMLLWTPWRVDSVGIARQAY